MHNSILYTVNHYNGKCRRFKGRTVFFMFLLVQFTELLYNIYIWARKEGSEDEKSHIFAIRSDLVVQLLRGMRRQADS